MTFESIQKTVIYGKTTRVDLEKSFGESEKIEKNQKLVHKKHYQLFTSESTFMDSMPPTYYDKIKIDLPKEEMKKEREQKKLSYVRYSFKQIGIQHVYFFFNSEGLLYAIGFDFPDYSSDKEPYELIKYLNKKFNWFFWKFICYPWFNVPKPKKLIQNALPACWISQMNLTNLMLREKIRMLNKILGCTLDENGFLQLKNVNLGTLNGVTDKTGSYTFDKNIKNVMEFDKAYSKIVQSAYPIS